MSKQNASNNYRCTYLHSVRQLSIFANENDARSFKFSCAVEMPYLNEKATDTSFSDDFE